MADPKYDQGVRREKDLLPYVVEMLPEDEFGDLQFDGELVFGSGEDGDVTVTTNTNLSEDMYYNNLTVNSGVVLNPNGWRVFVKNTLNLTGDLGIKDTVTSVGTGSLEGTVSAGESVTDGLGGAGEPDNFESSGFTFSDSGTVNTSVGVSSNDFYDLRDAINAYKQRGTDFFRVKGGAGGGTGADGVSGAGAAGTYPPNTNTVGAPGGKGSAGTGGTGGTGGRGGAVVMVSARQITGSGGLYCEGGASTDGTAGTSGTPAPIYVEPAYNHTNPGHSNPPVQNHHHVSGHASEQNHHETPPTPTPAPPPTPNPDASDHHHAEQTTHHATPPTPTHHHVTAHHHTPTPPTPTHHHVTAHHHVPGYDETNHHGVTNPPTHLTIPGNENPGHHNYQPFPHHNPGNHNPTNHMSQPGSHHHSSQTNSNPPTAVQNHHTQNGSDPNPDASEQNHHGVQNHHGTPPTNYPPGHQANPDAAVQNHHTIHHHAEDTNPTPPTPPGSGHQAAIPYPGGAGGTGYQGQRGGRGGGGVLIVVTRNAGTPSYSINTGVNGRSIALDTANI